MKHYNVQGLSVAIAPIKITIVIEEPNNVKGTQFQVVLQTFTHLLHLFTAKNLPGS